MAVTATLTTAGIVCLMAAIVGGRLRGLGFELPSLESWKRQLLLALLGLALLAGAFYSAQQESSLVPKVPRAPAEHEADSILPSHPPPPAPPARKASRATGTASGSINNQAVWQSIDQQIDTLGALLDRNKALLNEWISSDDATLQSISGQLTNFYATVDKIRRDLSSLRGSYMQSPEISEALEQAQLSPGAPMIPGRVFDNLLYAINGAEITTPRATVIPYVYAIIDKIDAVREWQTKTSETAKRNLSASKAR